MGVDKEFFLLFGIFDENLSWYLPENIRRYGDESSEAKQHDFEFTESNKMHGTHTHTHTHTEADVCSTHSALHIDISYTHHTHIMTKLDSHIQSMFTRYHTCVHNHE